MLVATAMPCSPPFRSPLPLPAVSHFSWMPAFIRFHPDRSLAAAVASLRRDVLHDLARHARPWDPRTWQSCRRHGRLYGRDGLASGPASPTSRAGGGVLLLVPIGLLGMVSAVSISRRAPPAAILAAGRRHDNLGLMAAAVACAGYDSPRPFYSARTRGLAGTGGGDQSSARGDRQAVVAASLTGHLAVFMLAALAILIPRVAARRRGWSP